MVSIITTTQHQLITRVFDSDSSEARRHALFDGHGGRGGHGDGLPSVAMFRS